MPMTTRAAPAGQGTVAKEFLEDAPGITTCWSVTGGGGFIGGMAAWIEGRVQAASVEPTGCPGLHNALAAARRSRPRWAAWPPMRSARQVGSLMFPIAQAHVAKAVLVEDDAIRAAQRLRPDRFRRAAEPGGATALAASSPAPSAPPPGARVGVLVCGSNTDPASVVG